MEAVGKYVAPRLSRIKGRNKLTHSKEGLHTYSLIEKKRNGQALSAEEISYLVNGLLEGKVANYQMSAFLMAVYFQGLDDHETAALTDAMLYSGKTLNFTQKGIVDKHSTGGVGDKTSFILAPLAASLGVKVPMVAGRGLGHTGGTIDKIESIPGFKTQLSLNQFQKELLDHRLVLMGQTPELAPADKKIYALRDVTATIESIPLITASIMSKKLAEGAQGIVMDIKVGNGAFMKTKKEARLLAKKIILTAKRYNRKAICYLSDMNQPLGQNIGNALEMIECFEVLKGKGPKDLTDLSLELASAMVFLAGKASSMAKARKDIRQVWKSGEGLKELKALIERQGGDPSYADDYSKFDLAKEKMTILSPKNGYISKFDTEKIGLLCVELGGGRKKADDDLDLGVGLKLLKKRGDKIKKDEPLLIVYHRAHQKNLMNGIKHSFLREMVTISAKPPKDSPLILEMIS